jgi:hypothetical protein
MQIVALQSVRKNTQANSFLGHDKRRARFHIVAAVSFGISILGAVDGRLFPSTAHAETGAVKVSIPVRIRYIFDLPWCSRWTLACSTCEKRGDDIFCEKEQVDCKETFADYRCKEFNAPGCKVWKHGCNTCQKIWFTTWQIWRPEVYCTTMGCAEYHAPNAPSFECLLPKSK